MFKRTLFENAHATLRQQTAAFLDSNVVPHHDGWTTAQSAPRQIWRDAGAQGLLCRTVPQEYGGQGRDFRDSVVLIEELANRRLPGFLAFLQSDIVAPYILRVGNKTQRETILPGLCSGALVGAVALTEPHSGSDLHAMQTFARRDGDDFILDGQKTHISNGSTADILAVAARSDTHSATGQAGFSMLLVDANQAGMTRQRIVKSGMRALDTSQLCFQNCRLPAANLLGAEGMGLVYLVTFLGVERLILSIYAQASAEAMLQEVIALTARRKTAAGSVLDFQATQFRLADHFSDCAANRSLVDSCIAAHLKGQLDTRAACVSKLRTTETLKQIAACKLQLSGAAGFCGDEGERATQDLIDSSMQSIWGGSSEILRDVIGRSLVNML